MFAKGRSICSRRFYLRLEVETFDTSGLEVTDQVVVLPDNYPSKGTGEHGAFFFDSEGNLLGLAQATG